MTIPAQAILTRARASKGCDDAAVWRAFAASPCHWGFLDHARSGIDAGARRGRAASARLTDVTPRKSEREGIGAWRSLPNRVSAQALGGPQVHLLIDQSGCSIAHCTTSEVGCLPRHGEATVGGRNGTWNSSQYCGRVNRQARTTNSTTLRTPLVTIEMPSTLCDHVGA